jgi:class 3 adenylate cyclase
LDLLIKAFGADRASAQKQRRLTRGLRDHFFSREDLIGFRVRADSGSQLHRPSKQIVIVLNRFTDLQESTAMTTRLGDAKALDLLHIHNSLTRHELREHTGREVKHLGDGIMASFASIDQSLECAISIQRAFAAYNVQNSSAPLHCGLD